MSSTRLLFGLVAAAALGCQADSPSSDPGPRGDSADGADACAFDVDDVSFLYPLPANAKQIGKLIGLDTKTDAGELLPQAVFAPLIAGVHPEEDPRFAESGFDQRAPWHVVSVRIDPCSRSLDPMDTGCHLQVRLVAQPVISDPNISKDVVAADHAIHLIYDVGGEHDQRLAELVADVQALRDSAGAAGTAGAPLGPHPALVAQGLAGKFAGALDAFIVKWVGRSELTRVAVMATVNTANWRFAGGLVVGGAFIQAPIPNAIADDGKPVLVQTFFGSTGVIGNFINRVSPPATSKDNVNRIVDNDKLGTWRKLTPEERSADANRAIRIDNPAKTSLASVDCVSCHAASHALSRALGADLVEGPKFEFEEIDGHFFIDPDVNPNAFRAPEGTTTVLRSDLDGDHYDVRAFGYNGDRIAINRRAMNESAAVAGALAEACRASE